MNPEAPIHAADSESMRRYYAERAAVYERVYHKPERQTDLRAMEAWLRSAFTGLDVLEVACGTGWWTPHGAANARHWLATDLNPETLALAMAKPLPRGRVRFAIEDAYTLDGLEERSFSGAFAGCWWSHVPLARLPGWIATLHAKLASGARVVFLDNSFVQTSNLPIHRRDAEGNTYQLRTLDDGSTYEVVKNFPTFEQALGLIGPRARDAQWLQHTHYWVLSYTVD